MSTIGSNAMTKVSEQSNTGGRQGGRIVWEGPSTASISPPATFNSAPLDGVDVTVSGGKKTVTASYNAQTISMVSPARTVLRDSDGAGQEVPIEQHPGYRPAGSSPSDPQPGWPGNWIEGETVINDNYRGGVRSYIVPGIVYRRTEYRSSFTFSEANLTANVGSRSAPEGIGGATTNAWLKTGISVQENADGGAIVTETWLWNKEGWYPDIHP